MGKASTLSKSKEPVERISPREEYDVPIFRTRLGKVLEKRGLSQRELAKRLERDPRIINLCLISNHKPDLLLLKGFAKELNISLDWLFGIGRLPFLDEADQPQTVTFNLNEDNTTPISFPKSLVLKKFGADLTGLQLISVNSADMAPTIQEGGLAFLKKCGFQNRSGIYMVRFGKDDIVRRVAYDAASKKASVSRDSAKDDKMVIPIKNLKVIGPVSPVTF